MNKKIIYLIILILLLAGIGFYFYNERKPSQSEQTSSSALDKILTLEIKRTDLTQEQIARYQEEFAKDKKIILTAPDTFNLAAFINVGTIKKIVGDFEGARDAWEYASLKSPKNSVSFFNLGLLYAEDLKDNQKAEANYLKCLENSKGESGNEQYYRGVVDFYTYFYPAQISEVEKILLAALQEERYQNSQDLMALLATYYQNNGQKEKAIEYWQKILIINPDNEGAKNELEELK
jgi:tetratricopeptide (TPR) repeat protein